VAQEHPRRAALPDHLVEVEHLCSFPQRTRSGKRPGVATFVGLWLVGQSVVRVPRTVRTVLPGARFGKVALANAFAPSASGKHFATVTRSDPPSTRLVS
jgi:hypothetical protein